MEADLVGLGRLVASALLCPDMDDDRLAQLEGLGEGPLEGGQVVTGHYADVGDPEVLEQLAGLGEVHHRLAQPLRQLEGRRADERQPLDHPVVGGPALLPGGRQLDLAEVLAERADGRADRHLVVVEHDQHLRAALADVVERLEAEPAHQGRIADHDRDPLEAVAQVARLRQALADGQAGSGMTAVEHVVGRFAAAREATDAIERAQRAETGQSAGQQLVGIRLVTGVPDDPVARRLEQPVEGDRDLDDPERRAEMAAGRLDRGDDRGPDLVGQLLQLRLVEAAQVGRALELGQDGHRAESTSGRLTALVDRLELEGLDRATGPLDEAADPQLRVRQQRGAALVEGHPALVQGERGLERRSAGLERGHGRLELGQRLVEGQAGGIRHGRRDRLRAHGRQRSPRGRSCRRRPPRGGRSAAPRAYQGRSRRPRPRRR